MKKELGLLSLEERYLCPNDTRGEDEDFIVAYHSLLPKGKNFQAQG